MKVLVLKCRCSNIMKLMVDNGYITRIGCSFDLTNKQVNDYLAVPPQDVPVELTPHKIFFYEKLAPRRLRCNWCDKRRNRANFMELKV